MILQHFFDISIKTHIGQINRNVFGTSFFSKHQSNRIIAATVIERYEKTACKRGRGNKMLAGFQGRVAILAAWWLNVK